jgi:hypothetical protein
MSNRIVNICGECANAALNGRELPEELQCQTVSIGECQCCGSVAIGVSDYRDFRLSDGEYARLVNRRKAIWGDR